MKLKKHLKKLNHICGFFLLFGVQLIQAQDPPCLLDVLTDELITTKSEEVITFFEKKGEKAYDAWRILYKLDPDADHLDINILEQILVIKSETNKNVEQLIEIIKTKYHGDFEHWISVMNSDKKTNKWLGDKALHGILESVDGGLRSPNCKDCENLASVQVSRDGQLTITASYAWWPDDIPTKDIEVVAELKDVSYDFELQNFTIVRDKNNPKNLYFIDGDEQLREKVIKNGDFKSIYLDMVNNVEPSKFDDEFDMIEEAMIRFYTFSPSSKSLNNTIVSKESNEAFSAMKTLLNRALKKIKPSPGTYYRGIGKTELDLIKEKNIGDEITYETFVSTSENKWTAYKFLGKNYEKEGEGAFIKVISKNGKNIMKYITTTQNEAEILHETGTKFKLKEIEFISETEKKKNAGSEDYFTGGYYHIVLEEI